MNKIEIFEKELNCIQNETIKNIAKELIGKLPDYFFRVPASSTGKYHPAYALDEGGLVRHTKAATRIGNDLLNLEMFNGLSEKKDLIIAALILHDGLKHGHNEERFVRADHPVLMSNYIVNEALPLDGARTAYENELVAELSDLVLTHMGQWNTSYKTKEEIMPKPSSKEQSFVHLCDYLASRKFLEFNFEV